MYSLQRTVNQGKVEQITLANKMCKILLYVSKSRFLASLLVEVGEYDISGPNEMMSTKEMKVETRPSVNYRCKRLTGPIIPLSWSDLD